MSVTYDQDVIVIGAGAAGCFTAIQAVSRNPKLKCMILEATRRPLTKVKISGGGRCNVTHHCFDPKDLVKSYPRGHKELLGPFHKFQPQDMIAWLRSNGVETVVEADGRMFPKSNKSSTIIDLFLEKIDALGIQLEKGALVRDLQPRSEGGWLVKLQSDRELTAKSVVLATGGMPQGHKLAADLGHRMVEPMPSLFTFEIQHPLLEDLAGVSFPKAHIELKVGRKKLTQTGPVLITHWGLSGPATLKLSAFAARELFQCDYQSPIQVSWVSQSKSEVFDFFQKQRKLSPKQTLHKYAPFELTKRFWARALELCGVESGQTWAQVSTKQCESLVQMLCDSQLKIQGKGVFKEEFVTSGGVSSKDIDFRTMESKKHPHLHFCGEILNIDGITGGFNFQNAWTTAWLTAAALVEESK